MIDRFVGVANLKSCKKGAKSARINLHHLRVPNPRKNRVLLAKFRENRINRFGDIAKTNRCRLKVAGTVAPKKKVLWSHGARSKKFLKLPLEHFLTLAPCNPSMIERFVGVANLKSCKKGAKSARINLHHLRVPDPRKNRVLLAKFRANRTNRFRVIAKTKSVPT